MIRVRVPASSANLGPGFDVLAAALELHLELEVVETGDFAVRTDLAVARDRRNLAVRGFARLCAPDRFEFRMRSEIPLSGGLGSSGAAYVAGLMAADAVRGGGADLLAHAIELEGHPDNVVAALLGGITAYVDGTVARLEPPEGLSAVLVVPYAAVRTAAARAALPIDVPLEDAAVNAGNAALLTLGLERGDLDLVAAALRDRIHQPYRAHLYPASAELCERAPQLGALGATISGAGPTVLVWCRTEAEPEVAATLERDASEWAAVLRVPFASRGAHVV